MFRNRIRQLVWCGALPILLLATGCRHKYENPITKDTQQPDKVLFDTSIDDIEHGRFERARLTLQTMMNTYDTSEYLAKAKLAVADSWKREGGAHGLAQAEAEYKDFILFYPNMEEAAEAQYKVCGMQYQQMDKPDRDPVHARLAEAECKDVLEKWPNSQYATDAAKMLREVQENLAMGEYLVGLNYAKKGGNAYFSSAARLTSVADQFPLFSLADQALWVAADDYNQMGDRFENQQAAMYTRIVRDYPLSVHAEDAKAQLKAMGRPVPEADPVAEARMKFEIDNRTKRSLLSKMVGPFDSRPFTGNAAKSGNPTMETFKPAIPLDVPETARGGDTTSTVTLNPVNPTGDILNSAPDARTTAGNAGAAGNPPASGTTGDAATDKPAASGAGETASNATANNPTSATNDAAAAAKGKKAKQPKAVTIRKRPKPSEQKKTAPTPAPQTAPPSDNTAPAKPAGGGAPEAPRQ